MSHGQEIAVQLFELQTEVAFKYGLNIPARTIQLVGEIDQTTFTMFDTAMTILEGQSKASITIKINSEGGSIYDALAIVGRIKSSKCKVVTEGYGAMMSAATLILASGAKRRMSKFSWFLHHEGSYASEGTVEQMKHLAKQMEREEDAWAETMEQFSETPKEFWLSQGKLGKDLYLDCHECLTLGVIDEVF